MHLLVDNDFPLVRSMHARKNLDQGTFAASILTCKTVDFRGTNREVDAVKSANSAETLAYTQQFDKCWCCFGLVALKLAH